VAHSVAERTRVKRVQLSDSRVPIERRLPIRFHASGVSRVCRKAGWKGTRRATCRWNFFGTSPLLLLLLWRKKRGWYQRPKA